MKRILLLLNLFYAYIISLLMFTACTNNYAIIKGCIKNANNNILYIEELNVAKRKIIDSVVLTENNGNSFSFKYKFDKNEPSFVLLRINNLTVATLLVDKNETLNYSGDLSHPSEYTVEGSQASSDIKLLNDELAIISVKFDSLWHVMQKQANDNSLYMQKNYEIGDLLLTHKQSLVRFIITHPKSHASITAIYQRMSDSISFFGKTADVYYYKILADSLSTLYPKSSYVQILNADYKRLYDLRLLQEMFDNAETGKSILDIISLPDKDGKIIDPSSLKAKVILVDFWLPSDKTQLMINRELINIYDKYHPFGFEVYQISEEQDKEIWIQAINNQNIKWVSVMDNASADVAKLCTVNSLPCNYLINEAGEVIGKNLFDKDLEMKLSEIFNAK